MVMDQMDGSTPLQSARPMAFIAMAVESECLFIILILYYIINMLIRTQLTHFGMKAFIICIHLLLIHERILMKAFVPKRVDCVRNNILII